MIDTARMWVYSCSLEQGRQRVTVRKVLKSVIGFIFNLLARLDVIGLEHVPLVGGCILAPNHLSRIDPALVFSLVNRDDMTALVADKYLRYPFFRWLVNQVGGIWLQREEADLHALRRAQKFLEEGGLLGVAPEGTRSHTRALIQAKTGVAYLAYRSRVPILPVAITGTEKAVSQLFRLHRPQIRIVFGKPFNLPPIDRSSRSAGLQRNTDEIMCRIAVLLPPAYRGVYADHPQLDVFLNAHMPDPETVQQFQLEHQLRGVDHV